jgi:diaminopimelate epimerase
VIEKGLVEVGRQELTVETLAGIKKLRPYIEDGQVTKVQVSMGTPKLKAEDIPVVIERSRGILDITLPLCYTVTVTSRELPVRLISMGNPHAVCFVNEPVTDFPLPELGPEVECHPSFPRRINFEVANIVSRNQIAARVWERGAGETLSCGSGACAIAVAARLCDYVTSPVDIILPGGTLSVEWDGKGKVLLTGPVEEVFTGEWPKE